MLVYYTTVLVLVLACLLRVTCLFLHWSRLINAIDVPLIHIDQEHKVISKDRQPVHSGHLDDKGE
jgi:hypothetical protein